MFQIPLNDYLAVLRTATPEEHPFKESAPEVAEKVGPAFAALAHAVADFVEAGRETIGYNDTRGLLEDMIHMLPVDENQADPLTELMKLMAEGAEDGPLFTEADGTK